MADWILVFIFAGGVYASGPHDLDTCKMMAADARLEHAACVHKDAPRRRVPAGVKEEGDARK